VDRSQPRGRYRGRRRAGSSLRKRYLAMLVTAIVGVGVVALAAGAALPDNPGMPFASGATYGGTGGGDGVRGDPARASRNGTHADTPTLSQPAPTIWVLPIQRYEVTSMFGRRWGLLHAGVDLGAAQGTPFYAAAAGRVVVARWNGGYGNNVQIDHGGGILTVYGHSSKLLVKEGQEVQAGERIALVGDTGHAFGAHLHFEVRVDGTPVEPLAFMRRHGVDIQKHTESIYD
jgi:murein DD-endopeptidase MepM/ murein hydrolase activator NlpD